MVYFTGKRPDADVLEKLRCVCRFELGPLKPRLPMTLLVVDTSSEYGRCSKHREAMRLGVSVITHEQLSVWLVTRE